MPRYWLLCCLLLALPVAQATDSEDAAGRFFDVTFGDFAEELQRAREEDKRGILLFFEMDDCPFCRRMKETVLNQPEVQDYFRRHFLVFAVDIEGDVEIVDFKGNRMSQKAFAFEQNRVRATPVMQFYNLDGEVVTRYTGATTGVDEFLWLGEYAAEGIYRQMPFSRYKRERKQAE